jgi:glycosyltransferase involved in cell wall biosynthesis
LRVAVLWNALSGYMDASLRALVCHGDIDLFISHRKARSQAPFSDEQFSWLTNRYIFPRLPALPDLLPQLDAFQPDVLLICGWNIPAYRRIARLYRGRATRVLCMDNQWQGRARQHLGALVSRWYIQPLFDLAWVSGSSSGAFARKLGFTGRSTLYGLNTCDYSAFAAARRRILPDEEPPHCFLYVGRLSPEKGIDVLAEGYRQYRSLTPMPWSLIVCGTGPEAYRLQGLDGVDLRGFVQPEALPSALAAAGCYVLTSHFETWSLSIHEATTVGLPVICTTSCGASAHLVQDGYNGILVDAGDPGQLARAMLQFTQFPSAQRVEMGHRSAQLSLQYTPDRWAETLLSIKKRHDEIRLDAGHETPSGHVLRNDPI